MPAQCAAVAVSVYKSAMNDLEAFSLRRCAEVLNRYPILFFGPESLDYRPYLDSSDAAEIVRFPDRYFRSLETYSELLVSPVFYRELAEYQFILIYQLDAFVFGDDLGYWCARDFDYIGAPWWREGMGWVGVGNGGFSLRKPARCLQVLESRRKEDLAAYWAHVQRFASGPIARALSYPRTLVRHLGAGCTVDRFLRSFIRRGCSEDLFWAYAANRYWPDFRVAPAEDALRFSIESALEQAAPYYAQRPPFGCHREKYLRMIRRFVESDGPPRTAGEELVWSFAERSGMARRNANIEAKP
jgi:hypothetical protein